MQDYRPFCRTSFFEKLYFSTVKIVGLIFLIISVSYITFLTNSKSDDQGVRPDISKLAFYNLENLFDTLNDPMTADDEFTPKGSKAWSSSRYHAKLQRIAEVISADWALDYPDILGLCEVENRTVLNDLNGLLAGQSVYAVLHRDSPDERGIDVAMLYNKEKFRLMDSGFIRVQMNSRPDDRTRDILYASLFCETSRDTLHVFVCHFPSRRGGVENSLMNRTDAASQCVRFMKNNLNILKGNIIIMGDMNDNPADNSMKVIQGIIHPAGEPAFHNLFIKHEQEGKGSCKYRGNWFMFDQILISASLLDGNLPDVVQGSAEITNHEKLFQKGKYKGLPFRNFAGNKWLNGYSDHLPVSCSIKLK